MTNLQTSVSDSSPEQGLALVQMQAQTSDEHNTNANASTTTATTTTTITTDTDHAVSELAPPQPLRRTSTASSSKLHDVIQDIINQFDPLKSTSASTPQLTTQQQLQQQQQQQQPIQTAQPPQGYPDMRSNFEPETDGFNYNDFLQQLRHPAAKPIARTVKNFLVDFGRRPMTLAEQVRFVHDFLYFIGDKMRECEVWQSMDDRLMDNAREGMEKLVMNRLYPLCFSPSTSDDADKDHVLREKMHLFRWIREEHLDVPRSPQNAAFLQYAREELLKMNNFKSPRDKVICILNCCTVIYGLLKNMRSSEQDQDQDQAQSPKQKQKKVEDVGADRFLPLLIYVVITACPAKIVSNVQYIMRFRSPERMQSEAGYYVTNLQGAMSFIETMDASCLSISQEEFDKNIEMTIWEMELEKRTKERNLAQQQTQQQQQQQQQQRADGTQRITVQQDMPGERAQWLIDRSSDLAKTTLAKTNNFVGRLISEFSSPSASESGRSTPAPTQAFARDASQRPQYPAEAAAAAGIIAGSSTSESPEAAGDMAAADGELVVGGPEWVATLGLVRDMFPNIDRDVVDIIFESNAGVVAKTIEQLLDISSDNEVLATATAMAAKSRDETQVPESGTLGGVSSTAVTNSLAASQGQDVAEEMEQWKKGHWANDSDSESESEFGDDIPAEQEPTNAASTIKATDAAAAAGNVLPSATVDISTGPLPEDDGLPSIIFDSPPPSATVEAKPLQMPDTSGDEEYARKLQEEFERQARVADNN